VGGGVERRHARATKAVDRRGRPCMISPVHALAYALGVLALAAGVVGVILPVVPGSLLLVGGTVLVGWAGGFARVGWGTIAFSATLGLVIWAVDLGAAALGTRVARASRWAVVGAGVGLLLGLLFGLVGILLGPALGAVVFEYLRNPDFKRALTAGAGAFVGFLLGSVVKVILALMLVGVVVVKLVI